MIYNRCGGLCWLTFSSLPPLSYPPFSLNHTANHGVTPNLSYFPLANIRTPHSFYPPHYTRKLARSLQPLLVTDTRSPEVVRRSAIHQLRCTPDIPTKILRQVNPPLAPNSSSQSYPLPPDAGGSYLSKLRYLGLLRPLLLLRTDA